MTKRFVKRIFWVFGIVAAATSFAGEAYAWKCTVNNPPWVMAHDQMEASIIRVRTMSVEDAIAAIKVKVAQVSASGSQEQEMIRSAQEAQAATVTEQMRREEVVRAKEQFSYETGQGVNACAAIQQAAGITQASTNLSSTAKRTFDGLDVKPGTTAPLEQQVQVRLNPMSTDGGVLLRDGGSTEDQRQAVIQQLAGLSLEKPDVRKAGTAAGDFELVKARRLEALRSPAMASLAAVAAMSSTSGEGFGGSNQSLEAQLDRILDQYGGGPKFQEWSAQLASQSERGLITELARLRGMSLALEQVTNDQQARISAVMATLLAGTASGGP